MFSNLFLIPINFFFFVTYCNQTKVRQLWNTLSYCCCCCWLGRKGSKGEIMDWHPVRWWQLVVGSAIIILLWLLSRRKKLRFAINTHVEWKSLFQQPPECSPAATGTAISGGFACSRSPATREVKVYEPRRKCSVLEVSSSSSVIFFLLISPPVSSTSW